MFVREIATDGEIAMAFPLMKELRERIREDTFLAEVRRQQIEGYRLYGGFDGERLVALAGVRRSHTLSRGEHLFVDDLVTTGLEQGRGHGKALLSWLATRCTAEGIPRIYLDSRLTAKGFYERAGFTFLTSIPGWIEPGDLAERAPTESASPR